MHTQEVVRQHSLLRRVLRRFWDSFWGGVLRRVLRRGPTLGFTVKRVLKRVLSRGSEKGVSRRHLECPLGEYDPLGVRPMQKKVCANFSAPMTCLQDGLLSRPVILQQQILRELGSNSWPFLRIFARAPTITLVIKMITCNFFLFWGINFLKITITITITSLNP